MAEEKASKFYTLMVVGDNHDEMLKKYDANVVVNEYVKYRYKDAGMYRKQAIELAKAMIDNFDTLGLNDMMMDYFKEKVKSLENMSNFEYYNVLTDGLSFNEDGDAVCSDNPDGKWKTCRVGRNLCIPLKLKDGSEVFQAKAGDVDWEKMHMANTELYGVVWDLYHGERQPENDREQEIYDNVKTQKRYFEGFESKEEYLNYSCSYWNYAYLDKDGWVDASDVKNYEWITGFYERFVRPLNPEDMVTIYECTKP